ncbi:eukaryotic translation initiation factor 2 [Desmophyllum pertusum]|uniref:Eukaryotic translation initiation factor 2 subunit 2 n=1 Tax=Desmophyllum pertusum TaxID=174260 RepID=A0A9X0CM63_9CNID|nr:eukaryotic translation initiation factor 2 [Desmophyllum pertusum]
MAEDEATFDPTMKKKKKKKKVPLDLDALEEPSAPSNADEKNENPPESESQDNVATEEKEDKEDTDILDLDDFSGMKKKKKKKKKPYDMEGLEDALPDASTDNKSEETGGQDGEKEAAEGVDNLDFSFSTKKKKKKKKVLVEEPDMADIGDTQALENGADSDLDDADMLDDNDEIGPAWSDRDYTYEELLTRAFDIMRAKNPEMVTGKRRKICKILHRQPKHLLAFLMAELGTSGSIDGNNQLIIKGRFQQKQIENVLRRYIKEYVTCHTCRSPDTILQKETRLFFIQCETCGSRRSVASIKSGFQAITQKRAQLKNKQQ